jgi:hypothetical protein
MYISNQRPNCWLNKQIFMNRDLRQVLIVLGQITAYLFGGLLEKERAMSAPRIGLLLVESGDQSQSQVPDIVLQIYQTSRWQSHILKVSRVRLHKGLLCSLHEPRGFSLELDEKKFRVFSYLQPRAVA